MIANHKKPFELLVDYIVANPQYGALITHQDISSVMHLAYGTREYSYAVSKANVALTKQQLRLKSVKGIGYRILHHNEYGNESASLCLQASKKIEKAKFINDCVDVSQLNRKEKQSHNKLRNELNNSITFMQNMVSICNGIKTLKSTKSSKKGTP
jgi:transcriptional antiterminator